MSFRKGILDIFDGFLDEEDRKVQVWRKGRPIAGYDPTIWRHDAYGRVIRFGDYGKRGAEYGWEIDHIHPVAMGGWDMIDNLRPLSCSANARLGGLLGALLDD